MAERKFWKQYMDAYEDCLSATSTRDAPWYVVPADDKENARLIISHVIIDTLSSLKMSYPAPNAAFRQELQSMAPADLQNEFLTSRSHLSNSLAGTAFATMQVQVPGATM